MRKTIYYHFTSFNTSYYHLGCSLIFYFKSDGPVDWYIAFLVDAKFPFIAKYYSSIQFNPFIPFISI